MIAQTNPSLVWWTWKNPQSGRRSTSLHRVHTNFLRVTPGHSYCMRLAEFWDNINTVAEVIHSTNRGNTAHHTHGTRHERFRNGGNRGSPHLGEIARERGQLSVELECLKRTAEKIMIGWRLLRDSITVPQSPSGYGLVGSTFRPAITR